MTERSPHSNDPGIRLRIADVLREVEDPELGADIVSLGLVYGIVPANDGWEVIMTLTYPGCPLAGYFADRISDAVHQAHPSITIRTTLTFDPPWSQDMMEPDLRLAMGFLPGAYDGNVRV